MSMDYTVIQAVRQRFGESLEFDVKAEFGDAPFVGRSKEFLFDCPDVSSKDIAILEFTSVGIDYNNDTNSSDTRPALVRINDEDVPGGLRPGGYRGDSPVWTTQLLLVSPQTLRAQRNVLYIEAAWQPALVGEIVDSFVIDNIILFFKTSSSNHIRVRPTETARG